MVVGVRYIVIVYRGVSWGVCRCSSSFARWRYLSMRRVRWGLIRLSHFNHREGECQGKVGG